jgi:putative addiction module component (TIGR02574 family)
LRDVVEPERIHVLGLSMAQNVDQLTAELMALPSEVRIEIAERLMVSVERYANDEIATAWREEIAERVEEHENGSAEWIPAADAMDEARRRLDERRQV